MFCFDDWNCNNTVESESIRLFFFRGGGERGLNYLKVKVVTRCDTFLVCVEIEFLEARPSKFTYFPQQVPQGATMKIAQGCQNS